MELLPKIADKVCFLRVFLTLKQLRWLIQAVDPTDVYLSDCVPATEISTLSYVIRFHTRPQYPTTADSENVEFTAIPPFKNYFTRGVTEALLRLKMHVADVGVTADSCSSVDLLALSKTIPVRPSILTLHVLTEKARFLRERLALAAQVRICDAAQMKTALLKHDSSTIRFVTDIVCDCWSHDSLLST
jgi:hypothetical protein